MNDNPVFTAPWNGMSFYWALWAIGSFVTFIVPEVYAIATGHVQNTLSSQVWRLESFLPGQPIGAWTVAHYFLIAVLLIFDVWLLMHFALGWWAN